MDDKKSKGMPALKTDRSFWGMTAPQFLGAFNDNFYKQLILLICVDYVQSLVAAPGAPPQVA